LLEALVIFFFLIRERFQSRTESCGNPGCDDGDEVRFGKALKKCGGYDVPLIQRCPQCRTPIEHAGPSYCKSVECGCGYKFNWVSLKGDLVRDWKGAQGYMVAE
jgi:hypothetical protein